MTSGFAPVRFDAPLVNPSPNGLFAVTTWSTSEEGEPLRWLPAGIEIRSFNYGGAGAFGIWDADWCAAEGDLTEDDVKQGVRPTDLDAFTAGTVWSADECDLTAPSRAEVKVRAEQNLRLQEQIAVESEFATRVLADAGTPDTAADIVGAVARLESLFAVANTVGLIHASAVWAASAAQANLIRFNGASMVTPLGHKWVFGGGYVDALDDKLVATSPTFGWRSPVVLRTAEKLEWNRFHAIAERSVLVGCEAVLGAVDVTG